ncbi:MAG TPA: hypothetical protein VLZ12_06390 [Verrucomicrobiae bacterium]|nr:hypothetical protein [Verrucomicrobiae bacterium]
MKKNGKKKSPPSLLAKAERALREAIAQVIESHRRDGEPLIVWRNGKVARIFPDRSVVRETRARYGK